jgi:hypothetical protein
MEVRDREDVGNAECLRDVTLALDRAHRERMAPDAVGTLGQRERGLLVLRFVRRCRCRFCLHLEVPQWINSPPFTSSVTPVK